MGRKQKRTAIIFLGILASLLCLSGGWLLTSKLTNFSYREILKDSKASLQTLTQFLTQELQGIEDDVRVMAKEPALLRALTSADPSVLSAANRVLDRFNTGRLTAVCYLMDAGGNTVAASNRNTPETFVGKNYKFRPYFQEAVRGHPGQYFALGVTSGKRGFYASYPVIDEEDKVRGVAVIKKEIDPLVVGFKRFDYCFLIDPNGIIFLSSKPDWVLKSLWPVSVGTVKELVKTNQFGPGPFPAVLDKVPEETDIVKIDHSTFLVRRTYINEEGWSTVLLMPTYRIAIYKMFGIVFAFFTFMIVLGFSAALLLNDQAVQTVRRSEERFEQVTSASQDWIWELDAQGRYTYSNEAVVQMLGYSPEEILGRFYYDFLFPQDKERLRKDIQARSSRKETIYRLITQALRKDGKCVILEITGSPMLDEREELTGYRGVARDVTEQKEGEARLKRVNMELRANEVALKNMYDDLKKSHEELQQAQNQLLQTEKLASIGQLAAGVAHEVKNPLAVIMLSVQMIEAAQEKLGEKTAECVEMIRAAADRANKVVLELLSFSRLSQRELKPVEIHTVLENTITLVEHSAKMKDIAIVKDFHTDKSVLVLGEMILLQQVFLNLLVNAVHAIDNSGTIEVKTSVEVDRKENQGVVVAEISDTGCGMSQETMIKIFDPFFTTKEIGKGTGLGLSTVYMILRKMNGKIHVESKLGQGTRFYVVLPLYKELKKKA